MKAIRFFFSKYADFSGRATRREFWLTLAAMVPVVWAGNLFLIVFAMTGESRWFWYCICWFFGCIAFLITPLLAVVWRRAHDAGVDPAEALINPWLQLKIFWGASQNSDLS